MQCPMHKIRETDLGLFLIEIQVTLIDLSCANVVRQLAYDSAD